MGSFRKINFTNTKRHNNNRSKSKLAEFGHMFLYGCCQHIYCATDIINFILLKWRGGGREQKFSCFIFYAHSVPFKEQCICTNYTDEQLQHVHTFCAKEKASFK